MTQYDPETHHRRSIRLRGWDYTMPGAYFITICAYGREPLFNTPSFREIVENAWRAIPAHPHAADVTLDEFVIMPDHVHGILVIDGDGGAEDRGRPAVASDDDHRGCGVVSASQCLLSGSIGAIVGNFKSLVARRINTVRGTPGANVWQRGFYDRIIRDDQEMMAVRAYIRNNPTHHHDTDPSSS
jgi:REP-associated tyrosine transposase